MKIKELIKKLSKFDGNLVVLTSGYEGGYNTPKELSEIIVVKDNAIPDNTWYYGKYSDFDPSDIYQKKYKPISAILL